MSANNLTETRLTKTIFEKEEQNCSSQFQNLAQNYRIMVNMVVVEGRHTVQRNRIESRNITVSYFMVSWF